MSNDLETNALVWADLEMTGLDPRKDKIIQIAVILTDLDLNIIEGSEFVRSISMTKGDMELMDEKVLDMHTKNGLIDISLNSKLSVEEVDDELVSFLKPILREQKPPLCGNSIHTDRFFIYTFMPRFNSILKYRNVDVSTVKQLANFWGRTPYTKPDGEHEALSDLKMSIDELKYYKFNIFDNVV